jgi:hypothetical protein
MEAGTEEGVDLEGTAHKRWNDDARGNGGDEGIA